MRSVNYSLKSGRSWWLGFALLIGIPALALALLGLRALRAERIEAEQQLREQQTRMAHLVNAAIDNALAQVEAELRRIDKENRGQIDIFPQPFSDLPLFLFKRGGLLSFEHDKVYFGETPGRTLSRVAPTDWPLVTEQLISDVLSAEAQGRTDEAMSAYRRIIGLEPKLSAWAEIGLTRLQTRGGGASARFLLANVDSSRWDGVTPTGLPAALLLCPYIDTLSQSEQARFVPFLTQTLENLRSRHWWLSYEERRFYDAELRRLLQNAGLNEQRAEDDRLQELAAIERILRTSPPSRRDGLIRTFERHERGSFLFLLLPSTRQPDVWLGTAFSQPRLTSLLDDVTVSILPDQLYAAAIRDGQGNVVWGKALERAPLRHAVALKSVNDWELSFGDSTNAGALSQRRLFWYGLVTLLIAMLASGLALTMRIIHREAELARLQNEFIAAVSHEFKSPITSIRLLMERIMSSRVTRAQNVSQYYGAINREVDRLHRHVDQLLEAQHLQEASRKYHFVSSSLSEIVEAALHAIKPQAEAKEISLETRTEGQIPLLQLDREAITRALEGLLDNAIKYSSSNTRITIVIRLAGEEVWVDVRDQGIGIERDELPRVFDKFYRGKRGHRHDVRGTGLGLALVKAAVEAHGGTIEVTSTPGQGSRFSVRLPIANGARIDDPYPDSGR